MSPNEDCKWSLYSICSTDMCEMRAIQEYPKKDSPRVVFHGQNFPWVGEF